MGYWDDGHMDDGWALAMLFGMLGFGLLIAVAVGLAVLWSVRSSREAWQSRTEPPAGSTMRTVTAGAEQILAERLARGEIDTEEYQARLDALRTRSPQ
jgi:putative membrane protein